MRRLTDCFFRASFRFFQGHAVARLHAFHAKSNRLDILLVTQRLHRSFVHLLVDKEIDVLIGWIDYRQWLIARRAQRISQILRERFWIHNRIVPATPE